MRTLLICNDIWKVSVERRCHFHGNIVNYAHAVKILEEQYDPFRNNNDW
jgi:hypothetical protein